MSGIAKRYVRALVQTADEQKLSLETLFTDIQTFTQLFAESNDLREALYNPSFQKERSEVLTAVLEHLKLQPVAVGLLRLLIENGRLGILNAVLTELQACMDARSGQLRALVISSFALSQAQLQRVTQALEKRLGHKVVVEVQVDTTIMGGLICKVGDLTFDMSLKRQLETLCEQLLKQQA